MRRTFYDASRFSRKEAIRYKAEDILEKNGVAIYSYLDCIPEDVDDAFIMRGINGLFAESFSRKNSKKSAIKLNSIAEQGYSTGAIPPFGYQTIEAPNLDGCKKRKVYALHPANAEIVEKIFTLALKGESGCSYGVKKIAAYLNNKNLLKNGSRWTPNLVHTILTNTTYYGERQYGKKDLERIYTLALL
ncbi:recombinase family protein [Thalassotalea hakodatensis]|uniref:recombinase family protein n=1 Tax=Thalassotalea hakodatensis TaxID=3030492 RepID=UPI00257412E1|nr:recombinase family protein [Thalassotalea hakodatensis]